MLDAFLAFLGSGALRAGTGHTCASLTSADAGDNGDEQHANPLPAGEAPP